MNKLKAVFLDRDGVITASKVPPFINKPEDLILLPDVTKGLRLLEQIGYLRILITNQGGVDSGFLTDDTLNKIHKKLCQDIRLATFTDIFYCPSSDPSHPDRKPNSGMILKAAEKWGIDLFQSYMVGDRQSDIQAGKNANTRTVLISPPGETQKYGQDYTFSTFYDFAFTMYDYRGFLK